MRASENMRRVWDAYISDNAYARDVTFDDTIGSIVELLRSIDF